MMPPGLILAAGKGTRIAPLARDLPKPLLQVGGRSLLAWHLRWLGAMGVREVWINLHHGADRVREAIGDGHEHGVVVRYSYEPVLLGTAGAWRKLSAELGGSSLVIYGDNLMRFDLRRLCGEHRRSGATATAAVFDPGRHAHTGIAGGRTRIEGGHIVEFVEGGAAGNEPINAGAYVLEPVVASGIAEGFQDFGHDVLPALARDRQLRAYVIEEAGFCLGLDTPERFAEAQRLVAAGRVAP
ncbi:MAG: nucleotidyltransferase family protein [Longimicrobiales bacterium]